MVTNARELHVDISDFDSFVLLFNNVLKSLCVSVPDGVTVVDEKYFSELLPCPDHEVGGVYIVMNEVLEVVILQDGNCLDAQHHG